MLHLRINTLGICVIRLVEAHVLERQYSRRRMIKHAKTRMDDGLEQQKVSVLSDVCTCCVMLSNTGDYIQLATDASNLIKHYKALLRS